MASPVPWADARAILTAGPLATVATHWPNEPFTEPDANSATVWAAVDMVGNVLTPIEVGGTVWQEDGTLYVYLFAPALSGSDTLRALAKSVANAFRGLGPRTVVYRSAGISEGAAADGGMWWGLTVSVDYVYQDST